MRFTPDFVIVRFIYGGSIAENSRVSSGQTHDLVAQYVHDNNNGDHGADHAVCRKCLLSLWSRARVPLDPLQCELEYRCILTWFIYRNRSLPHGIIDRGDIYDMNTILSMHEGERETLKVRKHWFILLREGLSTLTLTILPFIAAAFVAGFNMVPLDFFTSSVWVFLSSLWLLLCTMLLATIWTNFILDIWVVSTHRIMRVEQLALFNRQVVSLQLERVQNVSIEAHGIFATILGFGTITVETAGAQTERILFDGISHPDMVKDVILEHVSTRLKELSQGRPILANTL